MQRAALDRVVHHGLDAAAAARLRTEAERLVVGAPLDAPEAAAVVALFVDATEAAIAELHDEFRQLTAHAGAWPATASGCADEGVTGCDVS